MRALSVVVSLVGLLLMMVGISLFWGKVWTPWINSYFLGAALVAYGISLLWCGVTGSFKGLVGLGLAGVVVFGAVAIYLFKIGSTVSHYSLNAESLIFFVLVLLGLAAFGVRAHSKIPERMPPSVQMLLGLVFVVLFLEGVYLVIPITRYFPWVIYPQFAVPYGWACVGASILFGWALIRPQWENGYPALYALLVYNALCIGPLLSLLQESAPVTVIPRNFWALLSFMTVTGVWALYALVRRNRLCC